MKCWRYSIINYCFCQKQYFPRRRICLRAVYVRIARKRSLSGVNSMRRRSRIIDILPRLCHARNYFEPSSSSWFFPETSSAKYSAVESAEEIARDAKSGVVAIVRGKHEKSWKHRIKLKASSMYGFQNWITKRICLTRDTLLENKEHFFTRNLAVDSFTEDTITFICTYPELNFWQSLVIQQILAVYFYYTNI